MKKAILPIAVIFFVLSAVVAYGQKQNYPSKTDNPGNQDVMIDSRVDNMGYWTKLANQGLVPVQPYVKPDPAVFTGSEINSKSVKTENSPDVPVTNATDVTQSENSVFVDPTDFEHLLNSNNSTSWSGGSVGSLYGSNYFLSNDGGLNWGGSAQGAGGSNSGDPTTAISLDGSRMYVGFIHSNGGQGVSYSTDGGTNWTSVQAGNPPGGWNILDKNHMWIDNSPTSPYEGNLYNAWTAFGNSNDSDIELVRSTDEGLSWSSHMNISSAVNAGSHCQGVNLQTGPNGEVYAAWAIYDSWPSDETAIGFTKSSDGGATFDPATRIIQNIRGVRTTETSKNHRVNSFPVMAVDISGGGYDGNIYIVWANVGVPGTNTGNDIDIYIIRSEDDGNTWTTPVKVNTDPSGLGKEHYFPWITCDPVTGALSVVFYDDRNVSSSQCEVWAAVSYDAGDTWEDFKVSDVAFTPSAIPGLAGGYMGDYLGITSRDGMVYPAWTDNRDGNYMTYVSPFETNSLARPDDLTAVLDDVTGQVDLSWTFDMVPTFQHFVVYRDDVQLGTTTNMTYTDNLPGYGIYNYKVTAMHTDGESSPDQADVQWGDAHISVNPASLNETLPIGGNSTQTLTVENVGELDLMYDIATVITSKGKGSKNYCDASGGCDEYISNVTFGDINNSSSCEGYGDFTAQSTTVETGQTYQLTIDNGNTYSSDDLGVWIDWNQDQDFDDAGEEVVCDIDNGGMGTFDITVPSDAIGGQTRMRIRMKWSGSDCGSPCGSTTYGEVEDYTINVLAWLGIDITADTIPASQSLDHTVTFDASTLTEGSYTAEFQISSNDPDNPMVTVPVTLTVGDNILNVLASATPDEICEGENSQLYAQASGGTGNYSYSWTSNPTGFTSNQQDPVVSPAVTTVYTVEVDDGQDVVTDNVTVTVNELPGIPADPAGETNLCENSANTQYTTAGGTGALSYEWELSPAAAGSISGSGDVGIVNWESGWSGVATIKVRGVNDCGDGDYSTGLEVTVNALPNVTLNAFEDVCVYTPPFELTGGSPAGGTYAGPGVNNGFFDPETAGIGTHTITYTYQDANGCENFAEETIYVDACTGIEENVGKLDVQIYPNPNDGTFWMSIANTDGEKLTLRILNIYGKEMMAVENISTNEGENVEFYDLTNFADGVYFLSIQGNNANYIKKIIIRK